MFLNLLIDNIGHNLRYAYRIFGFRSRPPGPMKLCLFNIYYLLVMYSRRGAKKKKF